MNRARREWAKAASAGDVDKCSTILDALVAAENEHPASRIGSLDFVAEILATSAGRFLNYRDTAREILLRRDGTVYRDARWPR